MTDAVTGRRTSEQRETERERGRERKGVLYTQEKRIFHGIRTDIIHGGSGGGGSSSFSVAWHLGLAALNWKGNPRVERRKNLGKGELRFYPGVGWKHAAKWQDRSRVPIPDMDREREESGTRNRQKEYKTVVISTF